MKRHCAAVLLTLLAALPLSAQAPDPRDQQQLTTLIREIQAQQAQMADNQTKIETKMAALAETIRVARLFAGKAGK
jgi:endonuclease III